MFPLCLRKSGPVPLYTQQRKREKTFQFTASCNFVLCSKPDINLSTSLSSFFHSPFYSIFWHVEGVGFVLRVRDASSSINPSFTTGKARPLQDVKSNTNDFTQLPSYGWLRSPTSSLDALVSMQLSCYWFPSPPAPSPALTPCFGMAVNWGIIYFYFVSFTAGMTIPTSVQGMFCLGEKKKKKKTGNRNYKGLKLFD